MKEIMDRISYMGGFVVGLICIVALIVCVAAIFGVGMKKDQ